MFSFLSFISQYDIKTVEASNTIDRNSSTFNKEVDSVILDSGKNTTGTTIGNILIPSTLKNVIIEKLRTDLEWDSFNVDCEKGFYTISYLKKDDVISSASSHEVFAISTDIICIKDWSHITGDEIFKRAPSKPYNSSNVQSYNPQSYSTPQSSNQSSIVPWWWCFWCTKVEPTPSTNTQDNTGQQDNVQNTILQNTAGQQGTSIKQNISGDVNDTIKFSSVSKIYTDSAKNTSYMIKLPDGTAISSSGTIKLPDGSIKLIDGRIILPDGSIKFPNGTIKNPDSSIILPDGRIKLPDGTIKRPDGTIILPNGILIFPNISGVIQETKNSTNSG